MKIDPKKPHSPHYFKVCKISAVALIKMVSQFAQTHFFFILNDPYF